LLASFADYFELHCSVLSFFVLVISVLAALSVAVLITILFTLVGGASPSSEENRLSLISITVVVVGVCVIVNFFTAIFIVTTGITIYAGIRLSTLLRAHGAPGIGKWLDECKAVVIGDDQHHQVDKAEDRSDVSDESIVVVDGRKKEQGETDSVKAEEPKQG